MVGLLENLNFPERSLGVGRVLEGVKYFFEGIDLLGGFILHLPDVTIGPRSYLLEDSEPLENGGFNEAGVALLGHGLTKLLIVYQYK